MKIGRLAPRPVLALAIAAAILWAWINRGRMDPASFEAGVSAYGVLAPVVFVGLYIAGTVVFLPGTLFALASGALFGPLWGTLLGLSGATIGAAIAFLIARYLASDWVARKAGPRLKRLIEGVESEGWRFVAFVRLVPLFPFNLANYALGLTRIRFLPYVATTFVAMAPGALAYTWLGHAGREALAGNASALRYGLLALGLLAAIALLPRILRSVRGRPAIRWIEPSALVGRLTGDGGPTIVDVREPDEFRGPLGHLSGARNIPLGTIAERLPEIGPAGEASVVLVCRTDRRSASAANILGRLGFTDVAVLRGGMEAWNRDGLPVEGDAQFLSGAE